MHAVNLQVFGDTWYITFGCGDFYGVQWLLLYVGLVLYVNA